MRRSLITREHSDPESRVLVVTNMWPRKDKAAYGIFVKREVDALIDAGLRCDVFFIRGYRSSLAYPLAALTFLAWNWRSGRQYALVHGHSGETALAARFYLRAPVLVTYHGDDLLGTPDANGIVPLRHRIRRAIIRQHARLLPATLVQSREMRAALPRRVRRRDLVMPGGVDREVFRPLGREDARRSLGWDQGTRVALFAADPEIECKRHWLAAAAIELVGSRLDVRMHVARGVPPGDMPVLMSASDCLLLTSSTEGSPTVVKEALACNLPVVATPCGDVRERLERVEPSWLCEATPRSVASALVECLGKPRRSNGREVSIGLELRAVAERVLELYGSLAPEALNGSPRLEREIMETGGQPGAG